MQPCWLKERVYAMRKKESLPMKNKLHAILAIVSILLGVNSSAQIVVDNTTQTPEQLVQNVLVEWLLSNSHSMLQSKCTISAGTSLCGLILMQQVLLFLYQEGLILASGDVTFAQGPNSGGGTDSDNTWSSN